MQRVAAGLIWQWELVGIGECNDNDPSYVVEGISVNVHGLVGTWHCRIIIYVLGEGQEIGCLDVKVRGFREEDTGEDAKGFDESPKALVEVP